MARKRKIDRRVWWMLAGAVACFLIGGVIWSAGKKIIITEVKADGKLQTSDGKELALAGIRMKSAGEEGYEGAEFLLTQMVKNREVWIQRQGVSEYRVWIGCFRNFLGWADCSEGVIVNDELVKMGAAERR